MIGAFQKRCSVRHSPLLILGPHVTALLVFPLVPLAYPPL